MLKIMHELGQLEYGGVERMIANLIKFDNKNKHTILAYKDGPFREELKGVNIIIPPKGKGETVDFETDIIHIHSGGAVSEMALSVGKGFPIIETIHSPIRSPMRNDVITQRVGVTDAVSKLNHDCITIHNGLDFSMLVPTKDPEEIKKELGIKKGIPVIGRLGRIGKDKYLEEWFLVCYKLQQMGLEFVPLIIGGEAIGLDGYIGKLKLMAASLPVKGVIWAGHKKDVANYLQIMDIFLYPSATEGFGLVYVEAMYNNAVLVTYENEVSREIAAGYSILTGPGIEDLAQGVFRGLDLNTKNSITPIAHDWVGAEFDADRMAKDYGDLYERVNGHS